MNPVSIPITSPLAFQPSIKGLIRMFFARLSGKGAARVSSSDRIVFEKIIEKHKGLISKICFYYSSSVQEYEDLVQDTYINIWRGLELFRTESKETTWIYRVCLNTCISNWRKNARYKDAITLDSVAETSEYIDTEKENIENLHFLISLLSPGEKALIMLWLDEKSYDEIAELTGFNRNTVATKLRRIREKLSANASKYELK